MQQLPHDFGSRTWPATDTFTDFRTYTNVRDDYNGVSEEWGVDLQDFEGFEGGYVRDWTETSHVQTDFGSEYDLWQFVSGNLKFKEFFLIIRVF